MTACPGPGELQIDEQTEGAPAHSSIATTYVMSSSTQRNRTRLWIPAKRGRSPNDLGIVAVKEPEDLEAD